MSFVNFSVDDLPVTNKQKKQFMNDFYSFKHEWQMAQSKLDIFMSIAVDKTLASLEASSGAPGPSKVIYDKFKSFKTSFDSKQSNAA